MNKFIIIVCFLGFMGMLNADSGGELKYLLENKSYRTKVDMKVCTSRLESNCSTLVGAESSFIVLDNTGSQDGNYTIKCVTIYPDKNESDSTQNLVELNKAYFVKQSSTNGLPITKNVIVRASGMVSGPLINPR